jgi:hypothetical protein
MLMRFAMLGSKAIEILGREHGYSESLPNK